MQELLCQFDLSESQPLTDILIFCLLAVVIFASLWLFYIRLITHMATVQSVCNKEALRKDYLLLSALFHLSCQMLWGRNHNAMNSFIIPVFFFVVFFLPFYRYYVFISYTDIMMYFRCLSCNVSSILEQLCCETLWRYDIMNYSVIHTPHAHHEQLRLWLYVDFAYELKRAVPNPKSCFSISKGKNKAHHIANLALLGHTHAHMLGYEVADEEDQNRNQSWEMNVRVGHRALFN